MIMMLVFMIIDYCLVFSFIVVYSCRILIKFFFDDLKDELKCIIFGCFDLIVIIYIWYIYLFWWLIDDLIGNVKLSYN